MNYILLDKVTKLELSPNMFSEILCEDNVKTLTIKLLYGTYTVDDLQKIFSRCSSIVAFSDAVQIHSEWVNYNIVDEIDLKLNVPIYEDGTLGNEVSITLKQQNSLYVTQEDYDLLCDAIAEMSEVVYG